MDRVSFYGGVLLVMFGLYLLLTSRKVPSGGVILSFAGFSFRSRVPAFTIMAFGVVLMLISPHFPGPLWPPKEVKDFAQEGNMADYGCESKGKSTVAYTAPTGFKILSVEADTKDVVSSKSAVPKITSQDAHNVTADANFEGKDKDTMGLNCPGGGHGRVYVHGQIETE